MSMPPSNTLQKAIDIVQRAIDEDSKENWPEAYKQYNNALDYFMLAIKCKLSPMECAITLAEPLKMRRMRI
jgi:vacuolar protein-sorting-associated protein 4